jgi:hypothetical protein
MIRVTISNNVSRNSYDVSEDMTIGEFMDQHSAEIDHTKTPMLNGVTIDAEVESQTFAQRCNGMDTVVLSYTKNSEGN